MKTSRLLLLVLSSFCAFPLFSQIDFKLQLLPDGTKWGVYADPRPNINPSAITITGSGQITIVAPVNFTLIDLTPVSGNWASNAVINGPIENPTKSYISVGLVSDLPQIVYSSTNATLLFTFKKPTNSCPNELYLIENADDPFDQLPNSVNSNPGNELTVLDFGTMPPAVYEYGQNIAPFAWDCQDCDGDGIANALEDTNGDGQWTPGVDVSDLCNGAGGGGGGGCEVITSAALQCQSGGMACGNNPSGPLSLVANLTGGVAPFTISYTDGSNVSTLQGYQSGTPFQVPALNGAIYTLVEVTGADGCVAADDDMSGAVPVVIVPGALQITSQPSDASVCVTESTSFVACASATNTSFTVRWEQSSNQGTTWSPVNFNSGVFSESNLNIGCKTLYVNTVVGLNGYRFRAVAEGANASPVYSQAAVLNVLGPLQLSANPQNTRICAGETAVFNANFNNTGAGDIVYHWEFSHDNGASWWDVMPSPDLLGGNGTTLTLNNVPSSFSGDVFRLRASVGNCGFVYSQSAKLTVEGPVEILAIVSPVTVCRGEEACFEVQADLQGEGQMSYQWQERQNGSATWANIQGATAPIFCLASSEGRNGNCYRVAIRTASCPDVVSTEACLIVEDKAVFTQHPQSIQTCAGEVAALSSSAIVPAGYAGQVEYRWQSSADGGLTWLDLDNDGIIEGAYDATLAINDLSTSTNLLYRQSATTGICGTSYSEPASILVEGPVAVSEQPQGAYICAGTEASFSATATNLGAGSLHLQWQVSSNGIDWTNLAEGGNYTGTQTTVLQVQNATASRQYRLSASTDRCAQVFSAPATLTVEAPIDFSQAPENAVVCPDEAASFSVAAGGGNGALQLQWQMSQDGQNWSDIAEGGNFSGTQTATLALAVAEGLDGVQFRAVAASQLCAANSAPAVLVLEDELVCNPDAGYRDCVSLAVKKLENNIGWSVWVKADSSFTETPYQLPTGGKITLVAPIGFAFQGLTSHSGGQWKPGNVYFNPPQDPGKVYVEFNLTPNQNFLELTPGSEKMLFRFSVVSGCPSSLKLMDGIVPQGFFPNEFTGFGSGLTQESIPFHACGIYGQETWVCPTAISMLETGNSYVGDAASLEVNPSAAAQEADQSGNAQNEAGSFFGVAPNPTKGDLTVSFDANMAEKQATLKLWNLQGQVVLTARTEGTNSHRLDLGQIVPGTYFLALEVDGKLVQREKILVQ